MPISETAVILLAGVIVFTGHLVKGISGFGNALFAIPLLLLFLDVKFVAPTFLLLDLTSGILLTTANWHSINRRVLLLLFSGMVVGTGIGTWVLLSFDHEILKRILGVLVTAWALTTLFRGEPSAFPREHGAGPSLAPVSGFLGGILGATFGVSGPPIIIYLSHILGEKQTFRATLCGIFFAEACYKMVLFTANGLLNREVFRFALLMAPFVLVGVAVGSRLQRFLDERVFRKVVVGVLLVTGVVLMI
jgi:hypothetical protein